MNLIRLIIWKELRQLRNDPMTLRLMIMPVLVQIIIFGYAITTEVKHTPVTIVDRSRSPQSASMTQAIVHSPLFRYVGPSASEEGARRLLDIGGARAALIIPRDFAYQLGAKGRASVALMIDGQDANSSNVASGYINAIILGWGVNQFKGRLASQGIKVETVAPLSVKTAVLFNPMLKSVWYMIPAMAVLLVTMMTGLLTGFSIVKEREAGTMEQLMVTPLHPYQLLLGKIVPFIILGLLDLGLVLIIGTVWFGVPFRGSVWLLLLFGIMYMGSSLGLGILASTIGKTPPQVLFLVMFTMVFFMLLSGVFLPLENMPSWVQTVTYINPLRYFVFIMRELFLKGSGFAELWRQGLAMLGIGVVVFGMSLAAFRRKVG